MKNWLFLFLAIALEIMATTMLKVSENFTKPLPAVAAAVGYLGALWFFSLSLKSVPVGVAYAVWSGLGMVALAVIGAALFHQRVDRAAVIGIAFIVTGVFILSLCSKMEIH